MARNQADQTPPAEIGHNGSPVDYGTLTAALADLRSKKLTISEATGELRNAIKVFLEDHDLHKGAFATIRQIADMSDSKRADYLRTFDPIYHMMMDQEWAKEMRDLLDSMGEDPDDDGAAEDRVAAE